MCCSMLITTTALVSLMFMQPLAWKGTSKSDYWDGQRQFYRENWNQEEGEVSRWGTPPASGEDDVPTVSTCADASGNRQSSVMGHRGIVVI